MDNTKNYLFYKRYLYTILFCLYLTPSIKLFNSLPAIRIEEILLIIMVIIIAIRIINGNPVVISVGTRQSLVIGFLFFISTSILVGTIKGYSDTFFEFNEFIRVFKLLLIYTVAGTVFDLSQDRKKDVKNMINYIFVLSLILSIIVLQQYYNIFGLNSYYVHLIAPTQYETLVGGYPNPRPVGMIGNPNALGILYTITLWLSIFMMLTMRLNIKYLVVFFVNLYCMFLTMSRTSLIAFLIGFMILLFLVLKAKNTFSINLKKVLRASTLLIVLIIVTIVVLLYTNFTNQILWRFEALLSLETDNSWQTRVLHWDDSIDLIKESPLFGLGPMSRNNQSTIVDNEWLLLLRTYGFAGLVYFLLMFLIPYLKSKKNELRILNLAILSGLSVYMIPASVFNTLTLMPLIMIIFSMNDKPGKIITLTK